MSAYDSEEKLQVDVRSALSAALPNNASEHPPRPDHGQGGRSGTGAVDTCLAAGVNDADILKWDMAKTADGEPFDEILRADIFANYIYLSSKIPPFATMESLPKPGRRLRTICHVSCDPTYHSARYQYIRNVARF